MPSKFWTEDRWARNTAGFVSYGVERVPNALVRIGDRSVTTDAAGFYLFDYAPFRYDVSARLAQDVVVFRGAASRFLDLAVEREVAPRAWTGKITLTVPGAPHPGHALAAFASGDVLGLTGAIGSALTVSSKSFDITGKIHVVEYPIEGGLAAAVAKGSVDLRVQGNGSVALSVPLSPVERAENASFFAEPPPGFVPEEAELILDFGTRFSEATAGRVRLGQRIALPIMEDGNWTVRVRATRDGAVASSGRVPFAPREDITLTLFDAPVAVAPAADAVAEGGVLRVSGAGVFEHELVPLDGGGGGVTIHVMTASIETTVPDLASLGLPPARGRYAWTVRDFPDFEFVDSLSGVDVRLYRAASTSAPRTIVLP